MTDFFAEKYTFYIIGDGISATRMDVDTATHTEEILIVADQPTATLQGQVFWADTGDPVRNAVVSRSWYPWELQPFDMSMTLDRFETETDTHGKFKFSNLTEARYQLHIRAVYAVFEGNHETLSTDTDSQTGRNSCCWHCISHLSGKTRWHPFRKVVGTRPWVLRSHCIEKVLVK